MRARRRTRPAPRLRLISEATGPFAGLGYVAVFALLAAGRLRRPGRATRAVAALGTRFLSGYLAHSLLFSPLLAAWGLGLGAHLSSATTVLFAFAVWLTTVLAAAHQERHAPDTPGPAESLLRRRVYGPTSHRRPAAGPATP